MRFVNLIRTVKEAMPEWPHLDAVEEQLLNLMANAWHTDKDITMLETVEMISDASESTMHKRLSTLRSKGIIEFLPSATDGRVKLVKPTQLTINYFNSIEKLL